MDKLARLIKRIKMAFGYPLVAIELSDEDIQFIIEDSLSNLNQYSGDRKYLTIHLVDKTINLLDPEYSDIHSIVQVMKSRQSLQSNVSNIIQDCLGYTSNQLYGGTNLPQAILERKALGRLSESLEEPISFRQNGSKVHFSESGSMTIEYTPRWISVDDLDDSTFEKFSRYVEAQCKIVVGRARKKFTSSKALHEVDSSMLDEGTEQLTTVLEEFKTTDLLDPEVI